MPFIRSNNTLRSFAEYQDVVDRDQRLFEINEGLSELEIEDHLIRASNRLLARIRVSNWWRTYQFTRNPGLNNDIRLVPPVDGAKIIARQSDFTDLCVYLALEEYILPKFADFSKEDSADIIKIKYYVDKTEKLFDELIEAGDWYDFDADGTVEKTEKQPVKINLVRIR